jgi:drug/metabolite transporter (DMT)-like permease
MTKINKNIQKLLKQIPSSIYLGMAVLIFAVSNSITSKVIEVGKNHLIDGRNPISLCNILFVGNLCALGLMILIFHQDWKLKTLKTLTSKDWINLSLMGLFSGAITPALIFTALERTNITNIVLIGRIEPILTLILGACFLGATVNSWTVLGSFVSFVGVAVAVLLGNSGQTMTIMEGFHLGVGEIYVLIAAIIRSISGIFTKSQLQSIPLGIFIVYRNIVGTIIFFVFANLLYGPEHFIDAFSPFLWKWMFIYALIIVVLGQLFWLVGLKKASLTQLNLASLSNPILAIVMAYLILGEVPTLAQYLGTILLLIGLTLSFIGHLYQAKSNHLKCLKSDRLSAIEKIDTPIGFRGL